MANYRDVEVACVEVAYVKSSWAPLAQVAPVSATARLAIR